MSPISSTRDQNHSLRDAAPHFNLELGGLKLYSKMKSRRKLAQSQKRNSVNCDFQEREPKDVALRRCPAC